MTLSGSQNCGPELRRHHLNSLNVEFKDVIS